MNKNTTSQPIKTLLFLVTGFPPDVSGASLFNWERAVWLSQQGLYRVVVLAPDWQMTEAERNYPAKSGTNLIIDTYSSQPWLPYKLTHVPKFQSAKYINKQIASYQPDLIIVTDVERLFLLSTWQLPGKAYARRHNIPFLAEYVTDLYNFSAAYPGWQWMRSLVRRTQLSNYLYKQFDLTICPSKYAQASCAEMGITNTRRIPFYGVDVSIYGSNSRDRTILQDWLQPYEYDHTILLFLGRLGWEKRVDLLIEAFRQIKQQNSQFSLLIVGDGPDDVVRHLRNQAASIADIHFTGFLLGDKKAQVMTACDIFCSPCPYETFGRTTVEAMTVGLPVITVDGGAVAEYIYHEINGYLVKPGDATALQQTIQQVASHPQSIVIDRARQDAQKFSVDQGCQRLSHFYQQLLANHQSIPIPSKSPSLPV
jgi:phosphatidylinositol alpha 1,6-mannosyltransferase